MILHKRLMCLKYNHEMFTSSNYQSKLNLTFKYFTQLTEWKENKLSFNH